MYEQVDGVSMGSSMGPLLANTIMTQLEKTVIKPVIEKGTIKLYGFYVDDALFLVKSNDIDRIHKALNNLTRTSNSLLIDLKMKYLIFLILR